MRGVKKIGNDHYVNLGMHASFMRACTHVIMYAGFLPLNESFLKGVVKIGNDSYMNLGVHANFRNISCVHVCKVACSVHAPMSFYSYLPLFRGPVGGVK